MTRQPPPVHTDTRTHRHTVHIPSRSHQHGTRNTRSQMLGDHRTHSAYIRVGQNSHEGEVNRRQAMPLHATQLVGLSRRRSSLHNP